MKRSGKHFVVSVKKDYDKLVENLINNKAFVFSNGRKYKNFTDCKRSAPGVDLEWCNWGKCISQNFQTRLPNKILNFLFHIHAVIMPNNR